MRTKSRFVVILAALSLLIAMLPIGPAGAATGTVTLDKTFYSDIDTFNVVTVKVTDSDLSLSRNGTARITLTAGPSGAATPFLLTGANGTNDTGAILEGEIAKTDTFTGDASAVAFTLSKKPRDADADGDQDDADVVVKVGGTTVVIADYAVNFATGVVTFGTAPVVGTANITMAYEHTEYAQAATATTPVNLAGSTVKFGGEFTTATSEIAISIVNNATGAVTITGPIAFDAATADKVVIRFVYHVKDTIAKNVTMSTNTSIAGGKNRQISGVETTASSGIFESKVALFTAADMGVIESEAADSANDTGANVSGSSSADQTVVVGELNNTTDVGTALQTKLEAAATALGMTENTAAATFIAQVLSVADTDTITATYVDASPTATVTKTAAADLAAPIVTLDTPTDKLYTNDTLTGLIVNVVDTGAGVAQTDIAVVLPTGVTGGTTIKQPILNGFKVSYAPASAIAEGAKTWFIALKDKVGNIPAKDVSGTTANEGIRGAAPDGDTTADNPFQFTIDTTGPTVSSAATGYSLKNAGVTSGTVQETQLTGSTTWVRVVFGLGTGTAVLDATTVATSDFRVAGVEPLQAVVNSKAHTLHNVTISKESSVFLEVAAQATDARPKVELVGEIKDKAGNARTAGTISAASDKLAPVLTIAVSAALSEKSATVTVTSSEALVVNPTISTTITKPAANVTANLVALTVTSTGNKSWTAKFTNPANAATEQWVVVSGSDVPGNTAIVGDDSPADDLASFEVDDADPTVAFKDAGAATITSSSSLEEGAIWLVSVFDEDEYTGDSYKKVTVSEVKLKAKVSSTVDGDTITEALGDLFTNDNISYTLAVNLTPGTYNISIKGKDDAGNEVSGNTDFKVVAKAKFSLSMKPGINLVSIPGSPVGDGGNLNVLLKDLPVTSVVRYSRTLDVAGSNPWLTSTKDAETGLFTGDISVLEPGQAYFITATASTTAKVLIEQPSMVLPPTIAINQGFNAIGFWSIAGETNADIDDYLNSIAWTVAYTFDPTPGIGWSVIRPDNPAAVDTQAAQGNGYLVFATADGTLTP